MKIKKYTKKEIKFEIKNLEKKKKKIIKLIEDYGKTIRENRIFKTIKIQDKEHFPNGQWVNIAYEKHNNEINDDGIYFYVDENINLNKLVIGQEIELDEVFTIIEVA